MLYNQTEDLISWLKSSNSIDLKDFSKSIMAFDSSFNLSAALDAYFHILTYNLNLQISDNLEGLKMSKVNSIKSCIVNKTFSVAETGNFCKSLEPFLKKLFHILQENSFITTNDQLQSSDMFAISQFLKRLNRAKKVWENNNGAETFYCIQPSKKWLPKTGQHVQKVKNLYNKSLQLNKFKTLEDLDSNYSNNRDSFEFHFLKAYLLKNEQSHQVPDKPTHQLINDFKSTFITELYFAHFFQKEISTSIKKNSFNKSDFNLFISGEINKYSSRINKYVSLNLHDISNSTSSYSGFIEDVIENNNGKVRILGNGGTGKTTTVEHLVYKDLIKYKNREPDASIPILISMGTVPHDITIFDFIAKKLNVSQTIVEELFEANGIKLYVDGINEILKNSDNKRKKIQEIISLLENYDDLFLVITDRYEYDEYQSDMFNLPTFLLQKLNDSQVNEFIKNYCAGDSAEIKKVTNVIDKKSSISELLLRPLMLSRAIEIIKQENDLPEQEGKIIEKFIDTLLIREKNEKKDPNLRIKDFKISLAYVANFIWLKYQSNYAVNDFEFLRLLRECQTKFGMEHKNFSYIERLAFELEIISKDDDKIQFFHQSYLEFFCSYSIKFIDFE